MALCPGFSTNKSKLGLLWLASFQVTWVCSFSLCVFLPILNGKQMLQAREKSNFQFPVCSDILYVLPTSLLAQKATLVNKSAPGVPKRCQRAREHHWCCSTSVSTLQQTHSALTGKFMRDTALRPGALRALHLSVLLAVQIAAGQEQVGRPMGWLGLEGCEQNHAVSTREGFLRTLQCRAFTRGNCSGTEATKKDHEITCSSCFMHPYITHAQEAGWVLGGSAPSNGPWCRFQAIKTHDASLC